MLNLFKFVQYFPEDIEAMMVDRQEDIADVVEDVLYSPSDTELESE